MSAWCQALMDGVSYLIESFSGTTEKAMKEASSHLPPNMRSKMPSFGNQTQPNTQGSPNIPDNTPSPVAQENINRADASSKRGSDPLRVFKNPQVAKGVRSVYADYKMRQYEKAGYLEECLRQRQERLTNK